MPALPKAEPKDPKTIDGTLSKMGFRPVWTVDQVPRLFVIKFMLDRRKAGRKTKKIALPLPTINENEKK